MNTDQELFQQAMTGVEAINAPNRAAIHRPPPKPTLAQLARRKAALHGADGLTLELEQWYPAHDPLEGCRDGVQDGVYRKLRLGQYRVDARLDLTNMAPAKALSELLRFVEESVRFEVRTALIVHGRARRDDAPGNHIRSFLALWLPLLPSVLAYHSAMPAQGGLAATYLLLAKGDKAREANREQQRRGRK